MSLMKYPGGESIPGTDAIDDTGHIHLACLVGAVPDVNACRNPVMACVHHVPGGGGDQLKTREGSEGSLSGFPSAFGTVAGEWSIKQQGNVPVVADHDFGRPHQTCEHFTRIAVPAVPR